MDIWTNELIYEFLTLYENEPTLWNSSLPEYKNKQNVHEAWLRIKRNLKNGTISVNELKKRKDNLMSTYRKVNTKIRDSLKNCNGADDIYKPEWPFYHIMANFLDDIYKPRTVKTAVPSSDEIDVDIKQETYEAKEDDNQNESIEPLLFCNAVQNTESYEEQEIEIEPPKTIPNKKRKLDRTLKRMDKAYSDCLKQFKQTPKKDLISMYCDLLAEKLRSMKESTQELAMLEIDKLMYNFKRVENGQQSTRHDDAQMKQAMHQPGYNIGVSSSSVGNQTPGSYVQQMPCVHTANGWLILQPPPSNTLDLHSLNPHIPSDQQESPGAQWPQGSPKDPLIIPTSP